MNPYRILAILAALLAVTILSACEAVVGEPEAPRWADWSRQGGLRIGHLDEPGYAFGPVGSMAVAPDGSVITAHPRDLEIRVWTQEGKPAGMVGRAGQGPGEYRRIGEIGLEGDTLWVMDMASHRVTRYDLDGDLVGSSPLSIDPRGQRSDPTLGRPRPSHPLGDGTFYGRQSGVIPQISGRDSTPVLHLRLDDGGAVLDTALVVHTRPRDVMAVPGQGGSWLYGYQPFSDRRIAGFGLSSETLVVVDQPTPEPGAGATFRVTRISMTGDTLLQQDIPYEPRAVEADEVDRVVTSLVRRWKAQPAGSGIADAELERKARKALFVPASHPPIAAVVPGRDGKIWLLKTRREGSEAWWSVLDGEGRPLACVLLPINFRMRVAEREHVWGVSSGGWGVPYITRYDLGPAGSASGDG